MQFDPSSSPAQEFLGGLEDILYPKEDPEVINESPGGVDDVVSVTISEAEIDSDIARVRDSPKGNKIKEATEIAKIFSDDKPPPVIMGQLREKISSILLKGPGIQHDLGDKLRSVDRYIRLFFAFNFEDLSRAALAHFSKKINHLDTHPIKKQPNDPEITLDTVFNCLGRTKGGIGEKLEEELLNLNKIGLKEYADGVKTLLYTIANGSTKIDDFIRLISTLKVPPFKDRLHAVKKNLGTLLQAIERLQDISKNRQLLVNPSIQARKEIEKRIREQYPKEFNPSPDLSSDQLVELIENFELEVFQEMKNRGFHFNKNLKNYVTEPPFVENIRKELVEKLQTSQLIQILESKKITFRENLLDHWKELCFEAIKGKEIEYENHLKDLKNIDWKTYPWDIFYKISTNRSPDQRDFLESFFEKHAHEIPNKYLGSLVGHFCDPLSVGKLSQVILARCRSLQQKLSLLVEEDLHSNARNKVTWNQIILSEIDFEQNHPAIANFMNELAKKGSSIYFRIFTFIRPEVAKELKKIIEENCKNYSDFELSIEEWLNLRRNLTDWSFNYSGRLDSDFSELIVPSSTKAFMEGALLRFQDRSKPAPEGGFYGTIASRLEEKALEAISGDITLSKQLRDTAIAIQKKMKYNTYCIDQLDAIRDSYTRELPEPYIQNLKEKIFNSIVGEIAKLEDFPKDFLLMPATVHGHGMQLTIFKQPSKDGEEPKYTLLMTNTGYGIHNHASIEGEPTKYATTAKVGDVSLKQLTDRKILMELIDIFTKTPSKDEDSFKFSTTQIETLYSTLNSKVCAKKSDSKLQFLENSKNFYPVKREQHGGVCAVSCIRDINKTLFNLILFEKNKKSPGSFADSYLESELAMGSIDRWIAYEYLRGPQEDVSGKRLKIEKKGADTFKKLATVDEDLAKKDKKLAEKELIESRDFLISKVFGRAHKPMKEESSLGESARELKDLTKELVLIWLRENKKIEDIQKMKGPRILEVAKLRFVYKRQAIQEAFNYLMKIEKEEISSSNEEFILNIFKELKGFRAEHIFLEQLSSVLSKMNPKSENALFLLKLMNLINKDKIAQDLSIKIFTPYMKRLVDKSSENELTTTEYEFLAHFCTLATKEVVDILKPIFKNFAKRPLSLGEFYVLRGILGGASGSVQSEIIKNLLSAAKLREPKLHPREILFPFVLNLKFVASENEAELDDNKINLVLEVEKNLESSLDKGYLFTQFPEAHVEMNRRARKAQKAERAKRGSDSDDDF